MADPYGADRTPTGPTSSGMGAVTDQEIQMLNQMTPSARRDQLQQRAYQSYIDALARLRAAEGNPNAMGMSGAADAQNRLNAIRQPMASGAMQGAASGFADEMPSGKTYTYEVDGRQVQMTQEEMMRAVQSGQITPGQAASMATGVADPTGGSMSDADMGALNNLPEGITDLGSFLRSLQQKRNSQ